MKNYLHLKVLRASSFAEMFISLLIILATIIAGVNLLYYFKELMSAIISQTNPDVSFQNLISFAIQLVIAVEFVKMLTNHTAASAVEVLLVVVAKRVIVDKLNMVETLLGVVAFAILFLVRKYLNNPLTTDVIESVTIGCDITMKQFKKVTGIKLNVSDDITVGQYIKDELNRLGISASMGSQITLANAAISIKEVENDCITKTEVIIK